MLTLPSKDQPILGLVPGSFLFQKFSKQRGGFPDQFNAFFSATFRVFVKISCLVSIVPVYPGNMLTGDAPMLLGEFCKPIHKLMAELPHAGIFLFLKTTPTIQAGNNSHSSKHCPANIA